MLLQLLYPGCVLLQGFLFDVQEFSKCELVFPQLFALLVLGQLKDVFFFFQLRNLSLEVLGEQLQLVFNGNVLSNVAFVLLQLLLESLAVFLGCHARVRGQRLAPHVSVRTELGASAFSCQQTAPMREQALTLYRRVPLVVVASRTFFRGQKIAFGSLVEGVGVLSRK